MTQACQTSTWSSISMNAFRKPQARHSCIQISVFIVRGQWYRQQRESRKSWTSYYWCLIAQKHVLLTNATWNIWMWHHVICMWRSEQVKGNLEVKEGFKSLKHTHAHTPHKNRGRDSCLKVLSGSEFKQIHWHHTLMPLSKTLKSIQAKEVHTHTHPAKETSTCIHIHDTHC